MFLSFLSFSYLFKWGGGFKCVSVHMILMFAFFFFFFFFFFCCLFVCLFDCFCFVLFCFFTLSHIDNINLINSSDFEYFRKPTKEWVML